MNNSINFNSFIDLYVDDYKSTLPAYPKKTHVQSQHIKIEPKHAPFIPVTIRATDTAQHCLNIKADNYSYLFS